MKPKPLSSLNHLTVPVAIVARSSAMVVHCVRGGCFRQTTAGALALLSPGSLAQAYATTLAVSGDERGKVSRGELVGQRARRGRVLLEAERPDRVVALVVHGHAHAWVAADPGEEPVHEGR